MGRLRSTMNNRAKLMLPKQIKHYLPVSNVKIHMRKILHFFFQISQHPRRITLLTKEELPHIIINANKIIPLIAKVQDSLRTNKATAPSHKNLLLHSSPSFRRIQDPFKVFVTPIRVYNF